ncbi:MAG: hypothetical protein ACJ8E1_22625, partial [Xanthobacteraceae bacterium]
MTPVSRPIAAKAFLQADKAAMIGDGDVARLRGSWITTRVLYQVATPGSTLPPGRKNCLSLLCHLLLAKPCRSAAAWIVLFQTTNKADEKKPFEINCTLLSGYIFDCNEYLPCRWQQAKLCSAGRRSAAEYGVGCSKRPGK